MAKVLILENDPTNLHVFSLVLSSSGYEVAQAANEDEAISRCQENPRFDLFICDIQIGATSGTEIALQVHAVHPGILVLFVSGTPRYLCDERDVDNVLQFSVGSVDYLEKPFRPKELLASAKQLLSKGARPAQRKTVGGGGH